MTTEQFEQLFPLKAEVTAEIIQNANLYNALKCIGALTLKSVIPDIEEIASYWGWAARTGVIKMKKSSMLYIIETEENYNMMNIEEPTTVTFVIKSKKDEEETQDQDHF